MPPRPRTTARKRPSQKRSQETVVAIVDATARVLKRDGYDHMSTNKVALAAGVSIGSLYQYFPSKEALVAALMERHFDEIRALFEEEAQRLAGVPLEVAVRAIIKRTIEAHQIDPILHQALEQVPRIGLLQKFDDVQERGRTLVHQYLLVSHESLRPKDLEIAADLIASLIEMVSHGAVLRHPNRLKDGVLVDETVDLILRYLKK